MEHSLKGALFVPKAELSPGRSAIIRRVAGCPALSMFQIKGHLFEKADCYSLQLVRSWHTTIHATHTSRTEAVSFRLLNVRKICLPPRWTDFLSQVVTSISLASVDKFEYTKY